MSDIASAFEQHSLLDSIENQIPEERANDVEDELNELEDYLIPHWTSNSLRVLTETSEGFSFNLKFYACTLSVPAIPPEHRLS